MYIKKVSVSLLLLFLAIMLTSCSGASNTSMSSNSAYDSAPKAEAKYSYEDSAVQEMMVAEDTVGTAPAPNSEVPDGAAPSAFSKIAYTIKATIDTIDYDAAVAEINAIVERYNGFVESSIMGGGSAYRGVRSVRNSNYCLRIPSEKLKDVEKDIEKLGSVISLEKQSENLSMRYYDTEERIKAYERQLERLYGLLDKATTLTDIATLEQNITEIIYNLETLKSNIRLWDNSVSYSTVNINLNEVLEITEVSDAPPTFAQRISYTFSSSWSALIDSMQQLIIIGIYVLPFIMIIGLIAAVIIIILHFGRKRAKKKLNKMIEKSNDKE